MNIVVATVDYLLRLQESIRDFYWHHANHECIGHSARNAFLTSFRVTKQVFRTLTEYIQVGWIVCMRMYMYVHACLADFKNINAHTLQFSKKNNEVHTHVTSST